jgi:predicted dehydrogenase
MRVKELIDDGYVGTPELALVRMLRGPAQAIAPDPGEFNEGRDSAAAGAGLLFSLGSHFIDGLRHWFGDVVAVDGSVLTMNPERVRGGLQAKADADDTFLCTLRFASGVTAEIVASRAASFGDVAEIAVHGTEGVLITPQESFNPPSHGRLLGARRGVDTGPKPLDIPERLEPFADDRDDRLMPFRLLVREFCRGIDEGSSPAPNFTDGYRCQQILDAVRESSSTGSRVTITD